MNALVIAGAVAAIVIAGPRGLRVAQREHYLAGSASRFALRWWFLTGPANLALVVIATAAFVSVWFWTPIGLACAAVEVLGPVGLSLRGRTSRLAWTRRLRTTTVTAVGIDAAVIVSGIVTGNGPAVAAGLATLQPVVVDLALALCAPFERVAMGRFVRKATLRLRAVNPLTIALTGSYGKTTTKLYARHLIAARWITVASPASFNNTGGLARAINEQLADGTEVFIAEMGTYGRGEITAMCEWVKPSIGAIVNIGPVHLERMKSLNAIVAAKAEIVRGVRTAVINVDAYGLVPIADDVARRGASVIRFSAKDASADVAVIAGTAIVKGVAIGSPPKDAAPINVAAAIAVAVAAGVDPEQLASRLASLPTPEHRHEVVTAASGVVIIDNTFSSNPASAERSLLTLADQKGTGPTVVVTPGMVELGRQQSNENEKFARAAARVATDVIVVGRTNRRALDRGLHGGPATAHHVRTRDEAVAWVRAHLGPGGVVLYENDLPDHYP